MPPPPHSLEFLKILPPPIKRKLQDAGVLTHHVVLAYEYHLIYTIFIHCPVFRVGPSGAYQGSPAAPQLRLSLKFKPACGQKKKIL